jgi:hypothetical protein
MIMKLKIRDHGSRGAVEPVKEEERTISMVQRLLEKYFNVYESTVNRFQMLE